MKEQAAIRDGFLAITGCNSGLGYETMRVLALRGAHVIGIARTAEKAEQACASIDGAATTCYGATSPDLVGVRGFYFADCNANEGGTPYVYDDAMAQKLWQVSEELTRDYLPATRRA